MDRRFLLISTGGEREIGKLSLLFRSGWSIHQGFWSNCHESPLESPWKRVPVLRCSTLRVRHLRRRHSPRDQELKGRRGETMVEPNHSRLQRTSRQAQVKHLSQSLEPYSKVIIRYHKIHSDPSRWNTPILFLSHSLRTLHFFPTLLQMHGKDWEPRAEAELPQLRKAAAGLVHQHQTQLSCKWLGQMLGTWPSTLRKVNHSLHCLIINRQVIFLQGELCSEGHQIQKLEQSWSWLISSTSPCTTAVPPDISVSLSPPAQWRTNIPHTVLLNGTLDFDRLRAFGWCRSFRPTREKCWTLKYPPILKWESKDKNQHCRARPTPNFYWNSASRHHKRVGGQYSRRFFGLAQAPIMELQEICHTTPGIADWAMALHNSMQAYESYHLKPFCSTSRMPRNLFQTFLEEE